MKKILFISIVLVVFISCKSKIKLDSDTVTVSGSKIQVNNTPYLIKGICYHPVPKGNPNKRSFKTLTEDLKIMVEAGINTIRVYEPITDFKVLDQISAAGIKVIIGFGYSQGGKNDIASGTFIDYINTYKTHKAILMWEFGNEYNYHPEWFDGDIANWYKAMNAAATLAKKNDANHLTTTAHGDLPNALALKMSPNIDVWGMNVYRWDKPETIFKEWKAVSSKPMYLSETGADSYMKIAKLGYKQGENQKAQADATKNILKKVFENKEICSGVALFSFTDGWWKAGNNNVQDIGGTAPNSTGVPYDGSPNEEYWGIVDIDRNKKEAFSILKQAYLNNNN